MWTQPNSLPPKRCHFRSTFSFFCVSGSSWKFSLRATVKWNPYTLNTSKCTLSLLCDPISFRILKLTHCHRHTCSFLLSTLSYNSSPAVKIWLDPSYSRTTRGWSSRLRSIQTSSCMSNEFKCVFFFTQLFMHSMCSKCFVIYMTLLLLSSLSAECDCTHLSGAPAKYILMSPN